MTKTILIACPKGGVGKSVLGLLIVEWCIHNGYSFTLKDTDDNHSIQTWFHRARKEGRADVDTDTSGHPDFHIIDTHGSRASADLFLKDADVILAPVKVGELDMNSFVRWYRHLDPDRYKQRLYIIPNECDVAIQSRDQLEAMEEIDKLLGYFSVGPDHRLLGISKRNQYRTLTRATWKNFYSYEEPADLDSPEARLAVPPRGGSPKAFFNSQREAAELMQIIFGLLGGVS